MSILKNCFSSSRCSIYLISVLLLLSVFSNAWAENLLKKRVISEPVPFSKQQDKPLNIAAVYPGFQTSDYWQRSIRSLTARLDAMKVAYQMDVRFSSPSDGVALQIRQIQSVLSKDPDYLILTINSLQQHRIVELLLEQKKPKIIIQNLTQPIDAWFDVQPMLYVGFDHIEGAEKLAAYYRDKFPKGTPYGLLFWNKGAVSDQRGLTFERAVNGFHDLKASYYTNASRENARLHTLEMMKDHPEIKYIYACATDVALGAVDALKSIDRLDVAVNGWGGGQAELEAFVKGDLDAVLMRVNDQNGIAVAEAIVLDQMGESIPLVYSGDFSLLRRDMKPQDLDDLMTKAFVYSGKPTL